MFLSSRSRLAIARFTFSEASARAIPKPMPVAPAVISAVLPASPVSMDVSPPRALILGRSFENPAHQTARCTRACDVLVFERQRQPPKNQHLIEIDAMQH